MKTNISSAICYSCHKVISQVDNIEEYIVFEGKRYRRIEPAGYRALFRRSFEKVCSDCYKILKQR